MPRGTFQDCCYQCPCPQGEPLLTHTSTGDPPTLAGRSGSVSCGVTASFPWVLVRTRFCLYPPRLESLCYPVLWKSYNQIPLALKVRFPRDSQFLCQIPKLGSLTRGSEPSQQWENFFAIIALQFVGCPPARYGIWFYLVAPLHHLIAASLSLDVVYFFFFWGGVDSSVFLLIVQQLVAILVGLTEDECMSFYSVILNQNHKREINLLREKWGPEN